MADTILTLVVLSFPLLVAFAAVSDLLTMTIPNRISAGLILGFAVAAVLTNLELAAVGLHIAAGAGVLALTFTLFALGWIGGGDAKLAAAMALWMGPEHLLVFLVQTSVLGGLLTLGLLAFRQLPLPVLAARQDWIARLYAKSTGVPYGIALAAAGLLVFPETAWMKAAAAILP